MSRAAQDLERRIADLERENQDLRRDRAELDTRVQELTTIVGNTPAAIYLKDPDFRYVLVNRRYEQLAHVELEQIRGKTDYELFPKAVADLFRSQDEEVIRQGKPREFEETIPLPDGEFSFITVKFPVLGREGQVRAVGGFCTDITSRKVGELEREGLIEQLQNALKEVATLQKIIPICSYCKQIRDDQGYWNQIEEYLRDHSEMEFTHGICPACAAKEFGMDFSQGKGNR
ncbi:MAG: PAS domain-containing protein [Deltaproteobacteria bacterium]|nr:PAS domain-containing protein [Deltaproteobacteria bacterium]